MRRSRTTLLEQLERVPTSALPIERHLSSERTGATPESGGRTHRGREYCRGTGTATIAAEAVRTSREQEEEQQQQMGAEGDSQCALHVATRRGGGAEVGDVTGTCAYECGCGEVARQCGAS